MRKAAKRDANEAAIVNALRAAGIGVYRLNDPGAPDLACWRNDGMQESFVWMLEVKSSTGRLTLAQRKIACPRWIVRTPAEALAVFGIKGA